MWPLFARAPRHWFLENFLLSAPGVQSVFFLLRSVGRRDLSAGPEQKKKKKHHPGCFFAAAPGKAREGEAPLEAGTGPEQKKTPPRVFFFCCGPGERQGKEKPRWKPARGQSKKKTPTRVFFFWLRPRGKAGEGEAPLGAGTGPEQKVFFFFALAPCRRPTGLLLPLPFPGAGAKKKTPWVVFFFFALAPCRLPTGLLLPLPFAGAAAKKHPGWCFFFCSGPVPASNGASPSLAFRRGRSKKKNTLGGVFFFAAAPRGRSLTHCGPGWRCLPLAGAVFFFLLRPRPDRGGVFFLLWPRPDAHSLTVSWGDFGKARVVFFFLLRPRRVFLDNSKKCLGYYIGSKKTRPGHSFPCLSPGPEQKKNTLGGVFFFALAPCRLPTGLLLPLPFAGAAAKKHPGWCFFFCSGPVPASNGASPSLAFRRGRSKKKNTLGGVFFFCCGPARTLTHSLRAWVLPLAGAVFFFLLRPRPDRGGVFFFAVAPPGRSLTHGGLGRFRQGPGGVFFCLLRPRRVFLENSKKCLGYYIGSKKTRRGHSKKKNTTSPSQ